MKRTIIFFILLCISIQFSFSDDGFISFSGGLQYGNFTEHFSDDSEEYYSLHNIGLRLSFLTYGDDCFIGFYIKQTSYTPFIMNYTYYDYVYNIKNSFFNIYNFGVSLGASFRIYSNDTFLVTFGVGPSYYLTTDFEDLSIKVGWSSDLTCKYLLTNNIYLDFGFDTGFAILNIYPSDSSDEWEGDMYTDTGYLMLRFNPFISISYHI